MVEGSSMDASNILKPALARGHLRCIGATTLDEYRKYIEKDPALERRFQPVIVHEPSEEEAINILRGLRKKLEKHHNVRIEDSAIISAVQLSKRFITERYLPDKAIDLLDEAASGLKLQQDGKPEALERLEEKIWNIQTEIEIVENVQLKRGLEIQLEEAEKQAGKLKMAWRLDQQKPNEIKRLRKKIDELTKEMDEAALNSNFRRVGEIRFTEIPNIEKQIKGLQSAVTAKNISQVIEK